MTVGEKFIEGTARDAFMASAAKIAPNAPGNEQRIQLMQAYATLDVANAIRELTEMLSNGNS